MTPTRKSTWTAAWLLGVGLAAGSLSAAASALPVSSWDRGAALAVYLTAGAVTARWGLDVYGPAGGRAALLLALFAAPLLAALAGAGPPIGVVAQVATAYVLMRCLLDPTLQWVAASAAALLLALLAAAVDGQGEAMARRLLPIFTAVMVVARVAAAERHESRWRVARASLASMGLAWASALALLALAGALASLPSPEEYARGSAVVLAAAGPTAAPPWRLGLVVPLGLALLRPWRRHRRYSDVVWLAGLGCLAIPSWRTAVAAGDPGAPTYLVPFLALLAAAGWDGARPRWMRSAATAAVALHVLIGAWALLATGHRPPATGHAYRPLSPPRLEPPRAGRLA